MQSDAPPTRQQSFWLHGFGNLSIFAVSDFSSIHQHFSWVISLKKPTSSVRVAFSMLFSLLFMLFFHVGFLSIWFRAIGHYLCNRLMFVLCCGVGSAETFRTIWTHSKTLCATVLQFLNDVQTSKMCYNHAEGHYSELFESIIQCHNVSAGVPMRLRKHFSPNSKNQISSFWEKKFRSSLWKSNRTEKSWARKTFVSNDFFIQ